jgi:hypothetical protein
VFSSHSLQQLLVDLTQETERKRERVEPPQPMVHRADIVDDLLDVLRTSSAPRMRFVLQHVFKGALRALDLRAQNSLVPYVHSDEEIGIRKHGRDAVEPSKGPVRVRQELKQI